MCRCRFMKHLVTKHLWCIKLILLVALRGCPRRMGIFTPLLSLFPFPLSLPIINSWHLRDVVQWHSSHIQLFRCTWKPHRKEQIKYISYGFLIKKWRMLPLCVLVYRIYPKIQTPHSSFFHRLSNNWHLTSSSSKKEDFQSPFLE